MRSTIFLRINVIVLLCLCPFWILAQDTEPEYLFEIGGMLGGAFYMGDANKTTVFKSTNPAAEVSFRYNANFRIAWKANLVWARVSGSTERLENVFPNNSQASFNRNAIDAGGQMEFNFFAFSDSFQYLNTKRLSPYIAGGLGVTVSPGNGDFFVSPYLSLGTGVKYKLRKRFNVVAEWSVRKLFSDRLDVSAGNELLDNPYRIESGLLKNKDWYSMLMIGITYDFGLRNCNCNRKD